MEEKTVKMEPKNKEAKQVVNEPKQPTYDEMKNGLNQMYQENQYLRNEINKAYKIIEQMQVENGFKRLDCLFKSHENAHYFDDDYINYVINEIKEMVVIENKDEGSNDVETEEEPVNETSDQ